MTDAELVRQCIAGDASAMRALIDSHRRVVFSLCVRMLGHREDAEDVVQESFLRAFRSLHTWDQSKALRPWLLAIAANRCRTAYAKRKRRPQPSVLADDVAAESSDDSTPGLAEELELALAKLRENYRLCFILFYQQELSVQEVAEVMETREGTVKTWLHRARAELAGHLSRRGVGPENTHGLPAHS